MMLTMPKKMQNMEWKMAKPMNNHYQQLKLQAPQLSSTLTMLSLLTKDSPLITWLGAHGLVLQATTQQSISQIRAHQHWRNRNSLHLPTKTSKKLKPIFQPKLLAVVILCHRRMLRNTVTTNMIKVWMREKKK